MWSFIKVDYCWLLSYKVTAVLQQTFTCDIVIQRVEGGDKEQGKGGSGSSEGEGVVKERQW